MIDPYLVVGLAIFVIGVILLRRTKAKRYFVFFMFETRKGLRFVDKVARISPPLWKFLGDFAIVISFGGIGAYYVSKYRNTWLIAGLLGIFSVINAYLTYGVTQAAIFLIILVVGVLIIRKLNKPFFHLAALTIVIAVITYMHPMFDTLGLLKPYFSILVGAFGIPALLISLLFQHSLEIIVEQSPIPGVSPLLPGITEQGLVFFFPGTGIQIEFWQALIAIICLLVPHEFAHGVLTRCQKIKLKSAGILTAGPIPIGAFVEPDNKEMERHEGRERMRIYAAGSFTNLTVSIIAVLLFIAMVPVSSGITQPTYMEITNVIAGTPADGVLKEGFVIKEVNGIETIDTKSFTNAVTQLKPGQRITIVTMDSGTFELVTGENPKNSSVGYIGIDLKQEFKVKDEFQESALGIFYAEAILFITPTLFWIFFLSFNIALVNLLPVVPFDGGKMFEEIMREFGIRKRKEEIIIKAVIFIIVALLLVNALPLLNLLA